MAVLCCAQTLNKKEYAPLTNIFETTPFCHAYTNYHLSIKDFRTNSIYFKIFIYIHKNLFEPHASDHLEKVAESLLYNFHRKHILLKLKIKSYCKKLVLKTLQLEFNTDICISF